MKGDEIIGACDRHSNETVTISKHVAKYKNMTKWVFEFIRKFENRGIIIARVIIIIIILLKQDYKVQLANNKIQMAWLTCWLVVG